MPFGSQHIPPAIEIGILKESYKKDGVIANRWKEEWNWLVDEIRNLEKELAAKMHHSKKDSDTRTIKPIPATTAGFIGFMSSKPEFSLEKYGPDLMPAPTLPEIYNLKTNIFKYGT